MTKQWDNLIDGIIFVGLSAMHLVHECVITEHFVVVVIVAIVVVDDGDDDNDDDVVCCGRAKKIELREM